MPSTKRAECKRELERAAQVLDHLDLHIKNLQALGYDAVEWFWQPLEIIVATADEMRAVFADLRARI